MRELERGQKSALADIACATSLDVEVHMAGGGMQVDVACFGLDASGKLSDDRYMVFFNQTASPGEAVQFRLSGEMTTFSLDLARLPDSIDKLVFAASVDGIGAMNKLGQSAITLGAARFRFSGSDFNQEKAVIVGEIYRRGNAWRFGAVGQGFAGGLAAVLAHFGGSEATPASAPTEAGAASKLSPTTVSLTKAGDSHRVSLIKGAGAPAKLIVKATWVDNGDGIDNDDLDLRVGILLPDGRMKLVSAPDWPGAFDCAPFVQHLGDITGASVKAPATEIVEVNPAIAHNLGGRVALVFSVYSALDNGVVAVASLKPVMRMEYGEQVVECAFDFSRTKAANSHAVYTYVIGTAMIDGDSITLAASGVTSEPGSECTPWLKWAGTSMTLAVDGPAVFKGDGEKYEDEFGRQYA